MQITDAQFESEVIQSALPTLVEFWAPWCPPCKTLEPVVDALAEAHASRLRVRKVNSEEALSTAARYGIRAVPTLLLFKSGRVVEQIVGAVPRARLEAAIARHLAT